MARIGVVGAGLIGGSIARAAAETAGAGMVAVHDRDPGTRAELAAAGFAVADAAAEVARAAPLVVVAVPPAATAGVVLELLAAAPGAVVTDAASVKASVCEAVAAAAAPAQLARFVPGHPLAGHQSRGWRHADPGLLDGATWALAPDPARTDLAAAIRVVEAVTGLLGGRVLAVLPRDHDRALARTSHMPHVVATALMRVVGAEAPALRMRLSGGALRDGTRVAEADAGLWGDILRDNAGEVMAALEAMEAELAALRAMLADGRADALAAAWREGAALRAALGRLRWSDGDPAAAARTARTVDDLLAIGREGALITGVPDAGPPARLLVAAR